MTQDELKALTDTVGAQAAEKIKKEMEAYDAKWKSLSEKIEAQSGGVTEKQFTEWKEASDKLITEVKSIAEKQGTTITELQMKLNGDGHPGKLKSVYEQLVEDAEGIKELMGNPGKGAKTYMLDMNSGTGLLVPIKLNDKFSYKAAGPHASIADVGGAGNVASISQSLDAATLLRVGLGAPVYNQFRNTPWVFDLCNTINGTYDASSAFAMWFDEVTPDGGATTVAEGGTKPKTQYKYVLKSQTYKKKATILSLTEEFSVDFAQLENNILNVGRVDVLNAVNSDILANIITNATAYNSADAFKGASGVPNVNDYDAIAALAAQVDSATFGAIQSNAAVMSTNKKYRMGITKNTQGAYLNRPDVLANIGFVGNPAMAADDLLVGDFKQYNILLRGGMIVRVGYNGTDFGENKFSIVMEQYYIDYITTARKPAIVKGPDFATVRTAISA